MFEDLFCGVAVRENCVAAVVACLRELVHCATLKPFVSIADQLPTVNTHGTSFQLKGQRREIWRGDTCAGECRMKSAGPDPEIGEDFTEQTVQLECAWNCVMLTRTELTAEPLVHAKTFTQRRKAL